MDFLIPKYRRDPNEKVHSLYSGVAHGNRTVTTLIKKSRTEDKMEATRTWGEPELGRGESGRAMVLVIGGMETSLDEVEYILQAKQEKKFVPKRSPGDIVRMCEFVADRRNELIKHLRKNPSEAPKKRTVRMYLPVGYRYVPTSEPGLSILAKV